MYFSDIHIHALPGVDDGAQNIDDMKKIISRSYQDGTRVICFTPHYHPGYFGNNRDKILKSYDITAKYILENYPDLQCFLGNELRYSPECIEWLQNGDCKTLNNSRYVLVDFSELEEERVITSALYNLLNSGWKPVLAHVERYISLHKKINLIRKYRDNGILLQSDTQSIFRGFGFRVEHQCKKLLSEHIIDVFSSDAHNCNSRPPEMKSCFTIVSKKYGKDYAIGLFYKNAINILNDKSLEIREV